VIILAALITTKVLGTWPFAAKMPAEEPAAAESDGATK